MFHKLNYINKSSQLFVEYGENFDDLIIVNTVW